MKKIISALLSAALVVSSASAISASAESYGDGKKLVVLGDSIAAGYGLTEKEYNYGQLCADYLGGSVENYAVSGDETDDLLNVIGNFSAEQNTALSDADIVIISIGGNDLMQGFAKEFLKYAVTKGLLTEKYSELTEESIDAMDKINLLSLLDGVIDEDKLKALAKSDPLTFGTKLNQMGNTVNEDITKAVIIPTIQQIVDTIKAKNPDARIIVQTIYNPIQFEDGYLAGKGKSTDYVKAIDNVRRVFKNVLTTFATQLKTVEGIEIADIYTDFTSKDENSLEYSWCFTKMQESRDKMDIHPTQKGHLAIAANILGVIGETSENGSKMRQIYNSLPDYEPAEGEEITEDSVKLKKDYPAAAFATYKSVCGTYSLGDIDDNGKIDSTDASAILMEYALSSTNKPSSLSDAQKSAANLNDDDFIDSTDASKILSYYSKISTGATDTIKKYLSNK